MKKAKIDYFKQFKERFLYWMKFFGLNGWTSYFYCEKMDNGVDIKIRCDHTAKQAVITVNKEYKAEADELDKNAFEEVGHVLLSDLSDMASDYYNHSLVSERGHSIIFHLWNMIERMNN